MIKRVVEAFKRRPVLWGGLALGAVVLGVIAATRRRDGTPTMLSTYPYAEGFGGGGGGGERESGWERQTGDKIGGLDGIRTPEKYHQEQEKLAVQQYDAMIGGAPVWDIGGGYYAGELAAVLGGTGGGAIAGTLAELTAWAGGSSVVAGDKFFADFRGYTPTPTTPAPVGWEGGLIPGGGGLTYAEVMTRAARGGGTSTAAAASGVPSNVNVPSGWTNPVTGTRDLTPTQVREAQSVLGRTNITTAQAAAALGLN